jgi:hypothetical protein
MIQAYAHTRSAERVPASGVWPLQKYMFVYLPITTHTQVKDVLHLSAPAGPQEHDFHSHIRRDGPAGSHAGPGGR